MENCRGNDKKEQVRLEMSRNRILEGLESSDKSRYWTLIDNSAARSLQAYPGVWLDQEKRLSID